MKPRGQGLSVTKNYMTKQREADIKKTWVEEREIWVNEPSVSQLPDDLVPSSGWTKQHLSKLIMFIVND